MKMNDEKLDSCLNRKHSTSACSNWVETAALQTLQLIEIEMPSEDCKEQVCKSNLANKTRFKFRKENLNKSQR